MIYIVINVHPIHQGINTKFKVMNSYLPYSVDLEIA